MNKTSRPANPLIRPGKEVIVWSISSIRPVSSRQKDGACRFADRSISHSMASRPSTVAATEVRTAPTRRRAASVSPRKTASGMRCSLDLGAWIMLYYTDSMLVSSGDQPPYVRGCKKAAFSSHWPYPARERLGCTSSGPRIVPPSRSGADSFPSGRQTRRTRRYRRGGKIKTRST